MISLIIIIIVSTSIIWSFHTLLSFYCGYLLLLLLDRSLLMGNEWGLLGMTFLLLSFCCCLNKPLFLVGQVLLFLGNIHLTHFIVEFTVPVCLC